MRIDNMDRPVISVIIPAYQAGNSLTRALTSVIEQTFQSYEAVIIDGGSTDNTSKIALAFCERFPQIRFHSEVDDGVFDAMNRGLERTSGKWLYFLGADDSLMCSQTFEQVSVFLTDDQDVVYGNVTSPRWNGVYGGEFDSEKILNQNICHQAIFFQRTVFEKLGTFDKKYRYAADWEFNFRWMLSTKIRRRYIDQVIANYADGGLSSQNRDLAFEDDRLLLYISHGATTLPWKTKVRIAAMESNRAFRQIRPSLLLKSQFALLRAILK